LTFTAGIRDSGSYSLPVVVSSKQGSDTATIVIMVKPRYCTLSLKADSGVIDVRPASSTYRFGDTVSLKAIPYSRFIFVEWSGDVTGNNPDLRVVLADRLSVQARFVIQSTDECIELQSGSLNRAIKDASPGSARPRNICPQPGTYDQGTIKVWGTVRIVIQ
jgi:hypothetical protein